MKIERRLVASKRLKGASLQKSLAWHECIFSRENRPSGKRYAIYCWLTRAGLCHQNSPLSWRQKLPFYETAYRLVHHNRNSVGVCELARICGMGRDEVVGLIDTAAPGYFLRRGGSVFLVHPERRAST